MRHAPWVAILLSLFGTLLVSYLATTREDFGEVDMTVGASSSTLRPPFAVSSPTVAPSSVAATNAKVEEETFAVVSRMWRGDLPFLESWLRYYLVHLRVHRIYGIVTDKNDLEPLRALSSRAGFGESLQLWLKDLTLDSMFKAVFNPQDITETFLLSLDTDEYVAVPVGETLQSITTAEPSADVFELKWRCVPNDTLTEELIPRVGLRCPDKKVMFRTRRFKSFSTPHDILCGPQGRPKGQPQRQPRKLEACRRARRQLVLIHVLYRGVYDAMYRQSAGHTRSSFSDRNTGVEVVIADLQKGTLAQRLKHLAVGSACQDWLGKVSEPWSSKFRDLYGDPSPEGVLLPPHVFINQTEQLKQLDEIGIDENLRKRGVEAYHEFRTAFATALQKMICNPEFFCTRNTLHMIKYAKNLTPESMRNFQGPCVTFKAK